MSLNLTDGDIYINKHYGDLWVLYDSKFTRINDGYTLDSINHLHVFHKIGHLDPAYLDASSFVVKIKSCPICDSDQISIVKDTSNNKWKIGCNDTNCPCCITHMIGSYDTREYAINKWNNR